MFNCKLLGKYNSKKISYENALKIIESTKNRATNYDLEISNSFPDITEEPTSKKLVLMNEKHEQAEDSLIFGKTFGKLLLDGFILSKIFHEHFRENGEK